MTSRLARKIAVALAALHPKDRRLLRSEIPPSLAVEVDRLGQPWQKRYAREGYPSLDLLLPADGRPNVPRQAEAKSAANTPLSAALVSQVLNDTPRWAARAVASIVAGTGVTPAVTPAARALLNRLVRDAVARARLSPVVSEHD